MYKPTDQREYYFRKSNHSNWGIFKLKGVKNQNQCYIPHMSKFIKVLNKYKTFEEYRLIIFGILAASLTLFFLYQIFFGNLLYILIALPLLILINNKFKDKAKL